MKVRMKVLIVDDEIRLGKLIQKLIPWEEMGFTDMGCCTDSFAAFQRIQEEKPDIVITDIRIPKMTGLELIEKVRESDHNVYFIIISGYSDFSYAQSAVRFGVEDYILKPIRQSELIETLKKVKSKHSVKTREEKEKEYLKKEVVSGRLHERYRLFEQLLSSPERVKTEEGLQWINETYCVKFRIGAFRVLAIHFLHYEETDRSEMLHLLYEKIETILENTMFSAYDAILYQQDHLLAVLVNGDEETLVSLSRSARRIRSELKVYQEFLEDTEVYLYLSDIIQDYQELPNIRNELGKISMQRFYNNSGSILQDGGRSEAAVNERMPEKFWEDFIYYLETLNEDRIELLTGHIVQFLEMSGDRSGSVLTEVYRNIRNRFVGMLKAEGAAEAERAEKALDVIYENSSEAAVLFQAVFEKIFAVYRKILEQKRTDVRKPAVQAKEYINAHYRDYLSLEVVGGAVGLNPAYLSSLFKKETGMSFADYVTKVRIKASQKLLLQTDASLSEIAEKVGINDPKYFSRVFKKEIGMKPSDYRKLLS